MLPVHGDPHRHAPLAWSGIPIVPSPSVRSLALTRLRRLLARPRAQPKPVDPTQLARVGALRRQVLESDPWCASPLAWELERVVRAAAAEFRDRGQRPEQMVVALKRAAERGARPGVSENEEELHYRMILWSVREYFRAEW
ncbi:MAG: hypothetical protein ACJ8AO_02855 [Gemmatimonadaceae bacterium]